jgi:hypothetical protein
VAAFAVCQQYWVQARSFAEAAKFEPVGHDRVALTEGDENRVIFERVPILRAVLISAGIFAALHWLESWNPETS